VESFLSRSASDSGFQGEDDEVTWESGAGEAAWNNSLSSSRRETVKEAKRRARKEALAKELQDESDVELSDEEGSKAKDPNPRKSSLSPTQFLQSKAKRPLNRSMTKRPEAIGNSLVSASPVQVLEAKGKGASSDVLIEEVAGTVASGAISIQRDNQGSSSFSPPSLSFNLPPAERAQVLHRSLAEELILAGTGTSPLIPPARHSEEPSTAISMITRNAARRNNPNPSVQVPEAGAARVEAARLQQAAAVMEQEQLISLSALERRPNESRSQDEASLATTPARPTDSTTPVMDMRFCIEHLDAIRNEAGDFHLSDFSDYWAPDHQKTTPNLPNTFVPLRMLKGSNPLWGPFYNSGQVMRGSDGAPEPDPNHPPYFRVSAELLGRMLHTFKRQYVDDDLKKDNL
jgi:hypothetical protein